MTNLRERIHSAFDAVKAREELKESTKKAMHQYAEKPRRKRNAYIRYAVPALCCLVLAAGLIGYRTYFETTAVISVDINPSVEMDINCFDRVIAVEGFNEEADAVIESMELMHRKYNDAVVTLLGSAEMQEYLTEEALVSVAVAAENTQRCDEMQQALCLSAEGCRGDLQCRGGRTEDVQRAHDAGLSLGKYYAFLELQEVDPTVTAEEAAKMTMRQIRERIAAGAAATENTDESDTVVGQMNGFGAGNNGNGAGQGNGECDGTGKQQHAGNGNGQGICKNGFLYWNRRCGNL